jgi:hypothetical protein
MVDFGGGITRQYERLSSFFISYITVQSGAQLTLLIDQYSLWRAARTIGVATYLLILETFWVALTKLHTGGKSVEGLESLVLVPVLVMIFGFVLIAYITLATYSRLCFTLFSLVYVTYDKQIGSRKDAEPTP